MSSCEHPDDPAYGCLKASRVIMQAGAPLRIRCRHPPTSMPCGMGPKHEHYPGRSQRSALIASRSRHLWLWLGRQELAPHHRSQMATAAVMAPVSICQPLVTEGWALWAIVASGGAIAQVLATRTRLGQALSSPLIAMACGIAMAASGILPCDCPAFDVVWQYIMPMAAACYLLETDLSQLWHIGGPTLAAFLIGAVTMVVGAAVSYTVLGRFMGQHAGQAAACLCASYVGGSVNFVSVQKAVGLPANMVPACMAADNLAMAVFLAVLASAPVTDKEGAAAKASSNFLQQGPEEQQTMPLTSEGVALILATAAVACAAGRKTAAMLGMPALYLMFMAAIAAVLGSIVQRLLKPASSHLVLASVQQEQSEQSIQTIQAKSGSGGSVFTGASQIASSLMTCFFVIIGCSAGSLGSLARPETAAILGFLMLMVAVHWLLLWPLRHVLPMPALVLGSNANVGGPATAAAMASSKGWVKLVQPAMLSGSLGYAVGTMAGLVVARLLGLPVSA